MFTCGNGASQTPVSAFYHASVSFGATGAGNVQQQQASGSSSVSSARSGSSSGDDDSSTPLGTIVGGIIGGVAVILIAAFMVWFVMRKKRKDKATANTTSCTGFTQAPKPWAAQSQASELDDEKKHFTYSELPTPPVELPETGARYAHEAPFSPANPASVGRSELPGSESRRSWRTHLHYSELGGRVR